MKTIRQGDRGAAVEDVQRRLSSLGYVLGPKGIDGVFDESTAAAVRQFRLDEGLAESGDVDQTCWSALVDATFELGDRSLFLKYPFFHGSDVALLQKALNVLGFTCGVPDGIFGAHTERALREFQASVGIDPDGIAGSLSFAAIFRLKSVWVEKDPNPHSASQLGFSRASEVLERTDICVFGTDELTCEIAARIANLAFATTPYSLVTSAQSLEGAPGDSTLLVKISLAPSEPTAGIPHVQFGNDAQLSSRLLTAVRSTQGKQRRFVIDVPSACFADPVQPTVREQQHVAVTLLDALCDAGSRFTIAGA